MNKIVLLHSALDPTTAADALRRSIDEERRTIFSMSGYEGNLPVIGEVTESVFRLQKRRFWRNDFAPHFFGTFHSEPTAGTKIEGHFDISPSVKNFMRFWLIGVMLLGGPVFVLSLLDVSTGSHYMSGDTWVGVIVPPAMVLFGILLPRIGRIFGQGDERFILEHVQHALAARVDEAELTKP